MSLYANKMKDQVLKQYEIEIASLKRELANERKKNEEPEVLRKQLDAMSTEIEMLKTQNDALKVEVKHLKEIQAGKVIKVERPVKKVPEVPLEVASKALKVESLYDLTDTSDIIYFNPGENPCKPELDDDTKAMPPAVNNNSEDDFDNTSDIMYLEPKEVGLQNSNNVNANIDNEAQDDLSSSSSFSTDEEEESSSSSCDTYNCIPPHDLSYDSDGFNSDSGLSNFTFNLH